MYKEILNLLKCPKCGGSLNLTAKHEEESEIIEGSLSCDGGHTWAIHEGVINFGSTEQDLANNWTESYKKYDYEALDKRVLESTPENMREFNKKAKEFMINEINNKNPEFLLDIATGRGMLFTDLVKKLKGNSL